MKRNSAAARAMFERAQQKARESPTKPRPRMKRVSKRGKARQIAYKAVREAFMADHPNCAVCASRDCVEPATEVHHRCGREGGNLVDVRTFLPVCMGSKNEPRE
jgi:hypothetical protein